MNKNAISKVILMMLGGAVVGFILSISVLLFSKSQLLGLLTSVSNVMAQYSTILYILLIGLLYIPAFVLYKQGKRVYTQAMSMPDEEDDTQLKLGEKKLNLAISANGIFMVLSFMVFGMCFGILEHMLIISIVMFLVNMSLSVILELSAIACIQKADNRLKGDPTSFRFSKDYINSCDEAEKHVIYKSAYHSFQFTKNLSLVFVVFTTLCNMLLGTGGFPVFISASLMLAHIASYCYYAIKKGEKGNV